MYPQTVGETGVQNEVGAAPQRQKLLTGMALLFGVVTSFQPAGLQLYFLNSAVMGGFTGWLLRQNSFRRMIGIRIIPSKESNELYSRVAKGELKLKDIKGADGKLRYQPPTRLKAGNHRTATTLSGINLKSGIKLPAHLQPKVTETISKARPDRDVDFSEGPQGSLVDKASWVRRNYAPRFVWRRMMGGAEKMAAKAGYTAPNVSEEQARRKKRAEEYEVERRRRFMDRR